MKRFLTLLAAAALLGTLATPTPADETKPGPAAPESVKADDKPHIDVVFCIDCSGSMGPVIETAKQKVWTIVNEVARAKPSPVLRIGLLGYGNGDRTYRPFDLTDDLDEVYKNLVTFKDEGWGDEYVGRAVHKATNEFKWSDGKQVLRVIYVVGNETARQGPAEFDYTKTAPAAIGKGIIVNAIYCGNTDYAKATPTWREMAKLADGQYMEIAATGGAVIVATPFDQEMAELSARLNTTYVGYGASGAAGLEKQAAQDANAARVGGATAADRAAAKSARQYDNARWDLVDASRNKDFKLDELKDEQLPEELRKLTPEERKAYVEKKAAERAEVQKRIQEVAARRARYIKEEAERQGLKGDGAFDKAVRESIAEQAKEKGFAFEEK